MAIWYTAADEDELDLICKNYYGLSRGYVEGVLSHENNRELAEKLPLLEAGDRVYLPDLAIPVPDATGGSVTRLWE